MNPLVYIDFYDKELQTFLVIKIYFNFVVLSQFVELSSFIQII